MNLLIVLGIIFLATIVGAAILSLLPSPAWKREKERPGEKDKDKKITLGLFAPIRKHLGVPVLYVILVLILWNIEWTKEFIKHNFGLVAIVVVATILTPFLLEYKQKEEERIKAQKFVNKLYSFFVIGVIGLMAALNFG